MKTLPSMRLDFHSLYTFYHRVQGYLCRGLLLVLYLWHFMKILHFFLLSIICRESSSTSWAAILKVSSQWLVDEKISQFDRRTGDTSFHGKQISVHMRELAPETASCNRFASGAYLLPPNKPVWYEGAKVLLCNIFFARNHWCTPGSFAPGACCRSMLRSKLPRVYRPFTNVSPPWKHTCRIPTSSNFPVAMKWRNEG